MTALEATPHTQLAVDHEPLDPWWHPEFASIDELMARHEESVLRGAYRITRSHGAAEEVSQEVFLRAWSRGGFDPARGSLEGWLQVVTHHLAVDWIRREAAHRRRLIRVGPVHASHPALVDETAEDRARARRVRAAVDQLPPAERVAVSLAYFGGLTYREVAQRLNVAEGTVKSQIRRALTRLARIVDSTTAASSTTGRDRLDHSPNSPRMYGRTQRG